MSSTDVQQHGARAPPPTPSQGGGNASPMANNDAFSAFLEKSLGLANLVLPESPTATGLIDRDLPVVDLSGGERQECVKRIAEAAVEFGCFQVVNHGVCSEIVERAKEECDRLFELPMEKKDGICRSIGFPYGFDDGGCDTSTSFRQEMFWLQKDAAQIEDFIRNVWPEGCENFSRAVADYSSALEKVSSEILELLLEGVGNWPQRSNFTQELKSNNASLLCITNQKGTPKAQSARISHSHPYILGLHYQTTSYSYQVYVDRNWVRVFPQPGSLMVILGDILKVWSNGEYKSVVGRPVGGGKDEDEEEEGKEDSCTWMALLYSPAVNSIISPIAEFLDITEKKKPHYSTFALKDYASRLQKQRFVFKDPLDRYKIN